MKKFGKQSLQALVAGSLLAGLPVSGVLALPIVGLSVNGGSLGDILAVEVIGPKGPLAINVLGNQLPLPARIDASGIDGLLSNIPATGTPLDGLADMIPSDALPDIPVDQLAGLIPASGGAPGLPALPVDVVGTVTGLIPIPAGGGVPGLPALPVDVVGTVTGLIPAGGGVPGLPALPVDPVATLAGLLPMPVPLP